MYIMYTYVHYISEYQHEFFPIYSSNDLCKGIIIIMHVTSCIEYLSTHNSFNYSHLIMSLFYIFTHAISILYLKITLINNLP